MRVRERGQMVVVLAAFMRAEPVPGPMEIRIIRNGCPERIPLHRLFPLRLRPKPSSVLACPLFCFPLFATAQDLLARRPLCDRLNTGMYGRLDRVDRPNNVQFITTHSFHPSCRSMWSPRVRFFGCARNKESLPMREAVHTFRTGASGCRNGRRVNDEAKHKREDGVLRRNAAHERVCHEEHDTCRSSERQHSFLIRRGPSLFSGKKRLRIVEGIVQNMFVALEVFRSEPDIDLGFCLFRRP